MVLFFPPLDQVTRIHQSLIEKYGGQASLRDVGLLQSAMAMPSSMFAGQFLHEDLFEMAAAYLFHLVQNHPFIDGNKRVGAMVALYFLYRNGVKIVPDEIELADLTLRVASGQIEKPQIAEFFRKVAQSKPME